MRDGPTWRDLAACRGMDPNIFFPDQRPGPELLAELPCSRCAAKAECRSYGERFNCEGIWGGEFRSTRMVIARRRRRQTETDPRELTPEQLRGIVAEHDRKLEEELRQGRNRGV